jgi:hypothetical protein
MLPRYPLVSSSGVHFATRAEPRQASDPAAVLLPSSAPLLILDWDASCVGAVVRAHGDLASLREEPLYSCTVPASGRTVFSGLFAHEEVPSDFAGIVTLGDADFSELRGLFQLCWRAAPADVSCGVPAPFEFSFVSAGKRLALQDARWVAAGDGAFGIATLESKRLNECDASGASDAPWAWCARCATGPPDAGSPALAKAALAALNAIE